MSGPEASSIVALEGADESIELWVAPDALARLDAARSASADLESLSYIEVPVATSEPTPNGPAILLVTMRDLWGPSRQALLELVSRARPGRPVLLGGADDKDTLLDAINTWHVTRIVPEELIGSLLGDAIEKAREAAHLEVSTRLHLSTLRAERERLKAALAELRDCQSRLLHAERLGTMGRFARVLSKQLEEFLDRMESFARALERLPPDERSERYLTFAVDGAQSVKTLVGDIQALVDDKAPDHEELQEESLDGLVRQALDLFKWDSTISRREITSKLSSGARVYVDRYRMYHVLMNILRNAAQATAPGQSIEVGTGREASRVFIEVRDCGEGMPPNVLESLFDDFFTTKGRDGMGLGLKMARKAVQRHGGELEVESTPGKGSLFRICLQPVSNGHD